MRNKINFRLAGIAILAIIATVIGTTIIYYNLFEKQVMAELRLCAKLLTAQINSDGTQINGTDINFDSENDKLKELRITLIDKEGTVLYDNDAAIGQLKNHNDRPEIKEAFEYGEGQAVRRSDTLDEDTFYYAIRLNDGMVLRVATDAKSLGSAFVSVAPVIILIVIFIVLICIGISHMLTEQLLKPIEIMVNNLENSEYESPYKELDPIANLLRAQHTDILSAAKARQDFTANVSHELKTPLTAISGYAELLEGGVVSEGQQKHFFNEIRKNSDRLLNLINDIIRLSELDRKEMEPQFERISLYDVVAECMDELKVNARQRKIDISFDGEPCFIRANRGMIRELIENLAQNAIRYNNAGGKVHISVFIRNGRPILSVKDNGIGIPAVDQQRIFERFYRVDKSRSKETGGTGLGLAIVKHIVEIHDAKIELDSALGVGTTINIVF